MKKKTVRFIRNIISGIMVFVMLGTSVTAQAATNYTVNHNWVKPAPIEVTEEQDIMSRYGAQLPMRYDARNVNGVSMVTPVKNQGENNTCWTFALMAAMENNLILNGYADASIDLSENQFGYFFYNRKTDPVGYTKGDKNMTAYAWNKIGGSLTSAGYALATWAGVTTEQVSPYLTTPASNLCYRNDYSVKNVVMFPYSVSDLAGSVNRIKKAVLQYGGVATGIYFKASYMSSWGTKNGAYYYPGNEMGNHAVTIVGWDDNYPRENFSLLGKPKYDGAWIVKNSYGTGIGDKGYNYVSYEDKGLSEMIAVEAIPKSKQYDKNYQYDGTGNPMRSIGFPNSTTAANVFQTKGNGDYCEELKAVSVCSLGTNVTYQVQVYTGLSNPANPTSGKKVFSKPLTGKFLNAGYQTIPLSKKITLVPGEYFSVVITLKSSGKPSIGLDCEQNAGWISFKAKVLKNESFVYYNNRWYDMSKMKDDGEAIPCNVRIKAFTNNTVQKPAFKLSSKEIGVSKGSSEALSLNTNPKHIYRKVTWKGSNKSVATVSSSGTVTGKTYGETVVSAIFMKNNKKVTLKCKVTVGPGKIKNYKATSNNGKLLLQWNRVADADGYEICTSNQQDGTYKRLTVAKKGKKSMVKKLNSGTYYVKMRAYKKIGKKTLYGSYTTAKKVVVQ